MGGARAQALEEKTAWLWMAAALGPGAPNSGMALSMFPDARALAQACWKEDLSMVFTPAQLAALRAARPEDYTARLDDCARHGVNVLTWADEDYPDLLRAVSAPPPVLYYRGDAGIPNRCFTFAIVGTRRPSAYGVEATASIAGELARAGVALVSGLATGLDSESHKAAVRLKASSSGRAWCSANIRRAPRRSAVIFCSATGSLRGCPAGCAWPKRAAVPAP